MNDLTPSPCHPLIFVAMLRHVARGDPMKLKLFRHLWGIDLPWEQAFPKIKAEGFVGIEAPMPSPETTQQFTSLLKLHGFEYIAMAFTGGDSVAAHVKSLKEQVERAST